MSASRISIPQLARPVLRVSRPRRPRTSPSVTPNCPFSTARPTCSRFSIPESKLPRVAQRSLWESVIPSFVRNLFRRRDPHASPREWNPYTSLIVLGLLAGSQAIQLMLLRRDKLNYNRHADARIAVLREAVERVQRGEEVDVEGLLGTGRRREEAEWEEVMKQIEREEEMWREKRRKKDEEREAKRVAAEEAEKARLVQEKADSDARIEAATKQEKPKTVVGFF